MCSALLILMLWGQAFVESIRILELRVPGHAAEGGQALLGCQYDLEGDDLYTVKWYKDGREFYRFIPSNSEPSIYFSMPGVFVDLTKSASTVVALDQLTQESAGRYRCEVSGEAPYFVTVSEEKDIIIHLLPNSGPRLSELNNEYQVGDRLVVNCTSSRSRPRTQLKWLINDEPVSFEYLRGPWERISRERADARETTLELDLKLSPKHFRREVLTLKCQASIAPLYQNEVIRYIRQIQHPFTFNSEENFDKIVDFEENSYQNIIPTAVSQNDIMTDGVSMKKPSIWILFPLLCRFF
ncbi:uncharacterized protein LOC116768727 [Danaus plexippus]|nr:uncharacterized protein LOC116768727 [Danaus plexippus]XP_032515420.1 uncharacterized protein LOC116768727 isoform X2 [Danaus plexippus plexippus]